MSPRLSTDVLVTIKEMGIEASDTVNWYREKFASGPELTQEIWANAQRQIEKSLSLGIDCLLITDESYPKSLLSIENPPPVLYWRGEREALQDRLPGLAVVGTRKATKNGLRIAERIAAFFAERGWPIVSGLALGIDAAAHRGALLANGKTIAVLAHGLEVALPRTNKDLAAEILECGGAWVSEYPVGVAARPEQFVARNRIQIGLSAGSVIVEGEENSGSMTQAEFCLRNSRILFAVVEQEKSNLGLLADGPQILVEKRGAYPVYSKDDYTDMEQVLNRKKAQLMPVSEAI